MRRFTALMLAFFTIFTFVSCNVAPEIEGESTDTGTELLTTLTPEIPTQEPETSVTKPFVELPDWPSVKELDPTDPQALALQAYRELLISEDSRLKDMRAPYMGPWLREMDSISYALVDLGNDGVNELVIDCLGDTFIWRYYEGNLYSYEFSIRELYALHTDGAYSWNYNGSDFVYGQSQFFFEGKKIRSKELWRIVNDGEPNVEYYVEGKQVSQSEFRQYLEALPQKEIAFSTFEAPWKNPVSADEAYQLAKLYWKNFEIEKNGYVVGRGVNDRAPLDVYVFLIRRWVEGHYTTFDEIWIDVNTGEAIVPFAPDGK